MKKIIIIVVVVLVIAGISYAVYKSKKSSPTASTTVSGPNSLPATAQTYTLSNLLTGK